MAEKFSALKWEIPTWYIGPLEEAGAFSSSKIKKINEINSFKIFPHEDKHRVLEKIPAQRILNGKGGEFLKKITLRIIGRVRNSVREMKREGWESVVSDVILDSRLEEALEGIEDYSHVLILFWLSRVTKGRRKLKNIHPKSREDLPLVGIFATRTQYRPNPIGLTLVKLMWRKKNILRVRGLDAINGTPVIDIKPISPRQEFLKESRVPKWYDRLWKGSKNLKR